MPVSGMVTLDGVPLSLGNVIFTSDSGHTAKGQIQSDGSFRLGTHRQSEGTVAGHHRVAVMAREELEESERDPADPFIPRLGKSLIPGLYSDPLTSGLAFEVAADTENFFTIELTSRATHQ